VQASLQATVSYIGLRIVQEVNKAVSDCLQQPWSVKIGFALMDQLLKHLSSFWIITRVFSVYLKQIRLRQAHLSIFRRKE
jgi:hypothetical protein